jgi:ribosomal protein S18 acetylase RimI-like enzyme
MSSTRPIAYRRAGPEDAAAIAEIHEQSHRDTYVPLVGLEHYDGIGYAARLARWTEALKGEGIAFVALDGGQVVGFAHALDERITTLYILRAWHHRAIGRSLLRLILQELAQRGVAKVCFEVLALNAQAIAFYEAQGARRVGRREGDPAKGGFADILFEIDTKAAEMASRPTAR